MNKSTKYVSPGAWVQAAHGGLDPSRHWGPGSRPPLGALIQDPVLIPGPEGRTLKPKPFIL